MLRACGAITSLNNPTHLNGWGTPFDVLLNDLSKPVKEEQLFLI